jgi:hypothetical protein
MLQINKEVIKTLGFLTSEDEKKLINYINSTNKKIIDISLIGTNNEELNNLLSNTLLIPIVLINIITEYCAEMYEITCSNNTRYNDYLVEDVQTFISFFISNKNIIVDNKQINISFELRCVQYTNKKIVFSLEGRYSSFLNSCSGNVIINQDIYTNKIYNFDNTKNIIIANRIEIINDIIFFDHFMKHKFNINNFFDCNIIKCKCKYDICIKQNDEITPVTKNSNCIIYHLNKDTPKKDTQLHRVFEITNEKALLIIINVMKQIITVVKNNM